CAKSANACRARCSPASSTPTRRGCPARCCRTRPSTSPPRSGPRTALYAERMEGVIVGFTIIAAIVAVGYVVARIGILGAGAGPVLSRLAFFVLNPALLFTVLSRADLATLFSELL